MKGDRRIVLFGGQASLSPFREGGRIALLDSDSSPECALLLSRCHTSMLEEIKCLGEESRNIFCEDEFWPSPQELLQPTSIHHNNPIIQSTTLTLHQLLRYLAEVTRDIPDKIDIVSNVSEVGGFCTGMFAAVVVAAASSVHDFIDIGVEAFRLAFWTGYRSTKYCQRILGPRWNDMAWSMVFKGLTEDVLRKKLSRFREDSEGRELLHIAAISSSHCITVSGPGNDLETLRRHCPEAQADFVHIHGMYHGGHDLENVVEEICQDIHYRKIRFPSSSDLIIPIRSSVNGLPLTQENDKALSLQKQVIRFILVHPVDWHRVSTEISSSISKHLSNDPYATISIQSYGPSSKSLFYELKKSHQTEKRVQLVDMYQNGTDHRKSASSQGYAVVGVGISYPTAETLNELWSTIQSGLNAMQEIPLSRFNIDHYYSPQKSTNQARKMHIRHGNFADEPFAFDAEFFNISPREAKSMDPQQRLLLHTMVKALDDAGYAEDTTSTFDRSSFGCYIGVATGDYTDNLRDQIDVYYSPGTLRAFLSGKLSYAFRMSGPSIVFDTACSSSAVAIYHACRALESGDCKAAIAGGVNLITSPDMYLGLSRAHFLSPTGSCKPFDAEADGYSRAEGCGLFVLKKLSDAVAENDRIYAVIRGAEVNQCGDSKSITHPDANTQAKLFRKLLHRTGTDPQSVSVIEAHGTGTQAGDLAEISSLSEVFGSSRSPDNSLVVSSIKGSIGHAEAASGAASLAKILLMLRHGRIPAQSGHKTLNPKLTRLVEENYIRIPRQEQDWVSGSTNPRKAILNNFGAAGSNVALLVEEYVEESGSDGLAHKTTPRTAYPFSISARSRASLHKLLVQYGEELSKMPAKYRIEDVCYTATARRQLYEHRVSLTCTSIENLIAQIEEGPDMSTSSHGRRHLVFIFSGQGGSYYGMGRELMLTSEGFRDSVVMCDNILKDLGMESIIPIISSATPNFSQAPNHGDVDALVQCACFVFEYAQAKLWISWDIIPDVVIGHSLGEYVALVISGAANLHDILRVVAKRALLMASHCVKNSTGMLACQASPEQTEQLINSALEYSTLTVACHNSPNSCVVAGPVTTLETFAQDPAMSKLKTKVVDVPFAFHSEALNPIMEELEKVARTVEFKRPSIPLISSVSGSLMKPNEFTTEYLIKHTRRPVLFLEAVKGLQAAYSLEEATFIEIGPHPITLPMVEATIGSGSCSYLPSARKNRASWEILSNSLGKLFLLHIHIKWREVFASSKAKFIDLPGYPLQKVDYVVNFSEPQSSQADNNEQALSRTPYPLVPTLLLQESDESRGLFQTELSILAHYISGHCVGGIPICPASLYQEIVLEAAQSWMALDKDHIYILSQMEFSSPITYVPGNGSKLVRIELSRGQQQQISFQITTSTNAQNMKIEHCSGNIYAKLVSDITREWAGQAERSKRLANCMFQNDNKDLSIFQTRVLYQQIFTRVVDYSEDYQTLISLKMSSLGTDGYGSFQVPSSSHVLGLITPPYFTDTLLHTAGFIANVNAASTEICICSKVGSVRVLYNSIDWEEIFSVQCSLFLSVEDKSIITADAMAFNSAGQLVAFIEGMEFKKMQLNSLRAHLKRAAGYVTDINSIRGTITEGKRSSFSSTSDTPNVTPRAKDNTLEIVLSLVSKSCSIPADQLDKTKNLNSLGVDSLMRLELADTLAREFSRNTIDGDIVQEAQTIQDLINAVLSVDPTQAHRDLVAATSRLSVDENPILNTSPRRDLQSAEVKESLLQILKTTCGIDDGAIAYEQDLCSFGFDSLMIIEFVGQVREILGIQLDLEEIEHGRTIRSLLDAGAQAILSQRLDIHSSASEKDDLDVAKYTQMLKLDIQPFQLQSGRSENAPLYLFHDGSGLCNVYRKIGNLDRDVFAFSNPHFFHPEMAPKTLEALASRFSANILARNPTKLILGGWSFGGVVAFEVALQLRKLQCDVDGIILIDSPSPVNHIPLPGLVIQHITTSPPRFGVAQKLQRYVINQFHISASLLERYNPEIIGKLNFPIFMLSSQEDLDTESLCGIRYDWLCEKSVRDRDIQRWNSLVNNPLTVFNIPGNHFEPFEEDNISDVSSQILRACQKIEQK